MAACSFGAKLAAVVIMRLKTALANALEALGNMECFVKEHFVKMNQPLINYIIVIFNSGMEVVLGTKMVIKIAFQAST